MRPNRFGVRSFLKFAGAVVVTLALAFLIWLYWPMPPKKLVPSYSRIEALKSHPLPTEKLNKPSNEERAQGEPASSVVTLEGALYGAAKKACEGEVAQILSSRVRHSRGCVTELSQIDLKKLIDAKAKEGVQIDLETCIATDKSGEVSDLANAGGEMAVAVKLIIRHGDIPQDEEFRQRWLRLMGVGLCSLQKSLIYWNQHPEEMPSGDEVLSTLYFNPYSGRPEKSSVLESFFELFRLAQRK